MVFEKFLPYSTPKFLLEFHSHPTHLALLVANKLSQKLIIGQTMLHLQMVLQISYASSIDNFLLA